MSIGAFLAASSGIANINAAFAVMSQNVANASTADYAVETPTQTSVTAGGQGMGVRTGPTTLDIDQQLQSSVFAQNGAVAGLQTTQTALQGIDSVQGQVGGGTDLGSLLGALQDSFSTLETDPSSTPQQQQVVSSAQALAQQINTLSTTYETSRQTAQNNIVAGIQTLNTDLAQLGQQNNQIVQMQAAGQSTADLQNQRNQTMDSISSLIQVNFQTQPNGGMLVFTSSGLSLPTDSTTPVFSTSNATLSANSAYPGGVPAITMGGVDVTRQLQGGSLGADITLRDSTLPTYQAELDEFSQTLSTRMSGQGLTLFTDASGNVPSSGGTPAQSGYVGFSSDIQVNPTVLANPTLVVNGTNAVAGSATGASAFTPNPTNGPAGFTGLITRVLNYAFGSDAQTGVAQTAPSTTGLGPNGTLTAPFSAPADLATFAADVVSSQSADSAQATAQLTAEQSVQTTLQSQFTSQDGVSIDTEMSNMLQLQTAYGANAKVMTAIQDVWTQLLAMVQ